MATKEYEDIEKLARKARLGDREAFSKIVRLMMSKTVALTYRMTGDSDIAMDLAQDSFLAAWEKLSAFRGEAKFTSWLHQIAVNKCLNYLNQSSTRLNRSWDESGLDGHESAPLPPDPERTLQIKLLREGVLRFMGTLPAMQRAVFELRFYQSMSFGEIARKLSKAEGTVKTHYRQAVIKLRSFAVEKGWVS